MTPKPPPGLRAAGKRLWASVVCDYDLDEHETVLLLEAARTVDLLDDMAAAVCRDGAMVDSVAGSEAHPAAVDARQQRIAMARLLAALRLPAGVRMATTRRRHVRSGGSVYADVRIRGAVS